MKISKRIETLYLLIAPKKSYDKLLKLNWIKTNFLNFLLGTYRDSSGFLDIPARNLTSMLQDHGRLSSKSRIATRSSKEKAFATL